ncbi:MAG: PQQ-dependent sugar dehydrogenase [Bacteroidota bacterium]|nr:PQQ-dependent sugar dehydrogenase [Bacteroidota bacterium]
MKHPLPFLVLLAVIGINSSCNEAGNGTQENTAIKGSVPQAETDLPLDRIKLPSGFHISIYAKGIKGARSLALGKDGTVFTGTRDEVVYALRDEDGDKYAEKIYTLTGLKVPNGVAFRDGDLYVGEVNRILRYDDIESRLGTGMEPVVANDKLPSDKHHGWKYIAFGPDRKLYIPIGAPCNVCDKGDAYANIMRMNPDGTGLELFAKGIRNTVGFDWHPGTKELWFTDNGRDELGDNIPPDELNLAPEAGMHFGFPYCHDGTILDPEFGKNKKSSDYTVQVLGPHVAALGMKFYTGSVFPDTYKSTVFIAEHGSWNRSTKIGYRVMMVKLEGNKANSYTPFAEGWLHDGKVWGRPVDVLNMPDGSMLVSDDYAGVVYRIWYEV